MVIILIVEDIDEPGSDSKLNRPAKAEMQVLRIPHYYISIFCNVIAMLSMCYLSKGFVKG